MAEEFKLVSVHAAMFLADSSGYTQSSFLATILGKYSERYNGSVQALQIPQNTRVALPQVVLESSDGQWKLQAGPSRVDSFWFADNTINSVDKASIVAQVAEVVSMYAQLTPTLLIDRLGLLLSTVKATNNPSEELVARFTNPSLADTIFRDTKDFELHNHIMSSLELLGRPINIWTRCKSAILQPVEERVLVVEQDINTLEEDRASTRFSTDDILRFYSEAVEVASRTFSLYFHGDAV